MTAFDSMYMDDLGNRIAAQDPTLTENDRRRFAELRAKSETEWQDLPRPYLYGADYVDAF